jgi:hypothetical protein
MEPCGCNRWQPVANRSRANRRKQAETVAVGCVRLPIGAHGKEGPGLRTRFEERSRGLSRGAEARGAALSSGARSVVVLQELLRCELDLLVPPLRGSVEQAISPIRCRRRKSP